MQIKGSVIARYSRITADNTNNSASLATNTIWAFFEDYSNTFTITKFSSRCPSDFSDSRLSTMFAHFCYLLQTLYRINFVKKTSIFVDVFIITGGVLCQLPSLRWETLISVCKKKTKLISPARYWIWL